MDKRSLSLAAALTAFGICGVLAQSPVLMGKAGSWQKVFAAGLEAYETSNGSDAFSVSCDVASTLDGSATGLSIQFESGLLPPNSEVALSVDGAAPIVIPTDRSGGVGTRDCPACRDKLAELWSRLRAGSRLDVVASDGRRAAFSLDGTAALMPAVFCASS